MEVLSKETEKVFVLIRHIYIYSCSCLVRSLAGSEESRLSEVFRAKGCWM